jgi:hypothetical protein
VHAGEECDKPAGQPKEGAQFRAWIADHEPAWTEALQHPRRLEEPDDIYETTEAPWPSAEGYRIIWVRSSAKVERDAKSRRARIAAGIAAIDALNQRLASPTTRMKTVATVERAAADALAEGPQQVAPMFLRDPARPSRAS